ncbi:hypothetical protein R1flu_013237 [Riccia fluitans]|uniref:Uncharacterized protein n=1 Tax=Riccia fluitans TaxID=41844 RepID=A0ABD1YD09_9MARC
MRIILLQILLGSICSRFSLLHLEATPAGVRSSTRDPRPDGQEQPDLNSCLDLSVGKIKLKTQVVPLTEILRRAVKLKR